MSGAVSPQNLICKIKQCPVSRGLRPRSQSEIQPDKPPGLVPAVSLPRIGIQVHTQAHSPRYPSSAWPPSVVSALNETDLEARLGTLLYFFKAQSDITGERCQLSC